MKIEAHHSNVSAADSELRWLDEQGKGATSVFV